MLLENKPWFIHLTIAFFAAKNYILCTALLCTCTILHAQVTGCPDPAAKNYKSTATVNDGSCIYKDVSIKPIFNTNLNTKLNETSGLLWWNNQVWTHNDSGGEPALYAVDSSTGKIIRKVTVSNATNIDWEDLAQDDNYIYIGDFGNNAQGNRNDLKIYKVKKS
ncbi:hypothetical protein, partial [Ilyomonas limi]|uniref:hypothetical protein n=1 Tax=Ilyomonas limi TaxID=2575867 RepID=UPI001F10CD7F